LQQSPKQARNSHARSLQQQDNFQQVVRLIQQESWFRIGFIFCRFLLICQLEGLDLTFTLKWFFF